MFLTGQSKRKKGLKVETVEVGDVVEVEVVEIAKLGAFVKLPNQKRGLIHISQIANTFVKDVSEHLKLGDRLKARVTEKGKKGRVDLSLKFPRVKSSKKRFQRPPEPKFKSSNFKEKLEEFLKEKGQ